MNAIQDRHYFLIAVLFYGVSTVYSLFLWRKGFRRDELINYLLILSGFTLHSLAMVARGFSLERCPVNNLFEALMFVGWTIALAYLGAGLWSRWRTLGAFASPVLLAIGSFALMPSLDPTGEVRQFDLRWASLHAALILLSYGAFGLASAASVMYLSQDHDLKFRKMRALRALVPPIERLETLVIRLTQAGFVLLTIGLGLAPLLMRQEYGVLFKPDPKILWSMVLWLAYLILLVLHARDLLVGRRVAWGTVVIFVFILMTFWGFNLLSGVHNP